MQRKVRERANALLGETRGTSGQGGEVPLCPICRAGAVNSSKWDHTEKHCRVRILESESLCYKSSHRELSFLSPAKQRLRGGEIAGCKTSGGQTEVREKSH